MDNVPWPSRGLGSSREREVEREMCCSASNTKSRLGGGGRLVLRAVHCHSCQTSRGRGRELRPLAIRGLGFEKMTPHLEPGALVANGNEMGVHEPGPFISKRTQLK